MKKLSILAFIFCFTIGLWCFLVIEIINGTNNGFHSRWGNVESIQIFDIPEHNRQIKESGQSNQPSIVVALGKVFPKDCKPHSKTNALFYLKDPIPEFEVGLYQCVKPNTWEKVK